jgi:transposase InsO family protein
MTAWLRREGHVVNRKRVRRLMRQMGLQVIWQKPNTSQPNPEHKTYPYLLRGLTIEHQVWATDITYSAPRPGWSGVHMTGMLMRKEENEESPAPCCEGA